MWRFVLAITILAAIPWVACTNRNPDYDPDYVPPCTTGTARCSEDGMAIELCRDGTFVQLRECWEGTECRDARCVAGDGATFCERQSDCDDGETCTAVIMSTSMAVGNACIPTPYPEGRDGGMACSKDEDCKSGWCFRGTCYVPCRGDGDCPDEMTCTDLSVTIDSVRGVVTGCVREKGNGQGD